MRVEGLHVNKLLRGNMKDFKVIYKNRYYDDSALGKLDKFLNETYDRVDETIGFKFSYKGNQYGNVISGTPSCPITNKDVIRLLEVAVQLMNKLRNRGK